MQLRGKNESNLTHNEHSCAGEFIEVMNFNALDKLLATEVWRMTKTQAVLLLNRCRFAAVKLQFGDLLTFLPPLTTACLIALIVMGGGGFVTLQLISIKTDVIKDKSVPTHPENRHFLRSQVDFIDMSSIYRYTVA